MDSPGDLFDHLANEVGNLLVHGAVFVRVGEALSAEFLLDGVEAFVEVVAVVCGCGVHDFGLMEEKAGIGKDGLIVMMMVMMMKSAGCV